MIQTTDVNLEVLGLCVVDSSDETHHRVIAVDPPSDTPYYPRELRPYLAFQQSGTSPATRRGKLPFQVLKSGRYNRIDAGMSLIPIPPQTTVEFSTPSEALPKHSNPQDPVQLSDLGFGPLKQEVGSGAWQPGEAARFLLPKAPASSGWAVDLGTFQLTGSHKPRMVADLFYWDAWYSDTCKAVFRDAEGNEIDTRYFEGTVQLRIGCYSDYEPSGPQPFTYCSALSRLCQDGTFLIPYRVEETDPEQATAKVTPAKGEELRHISSGSCPPVQCGC